MVSFRTKTTDRPIAVIAKIDLYPEVMERRNELASKVASRLEESLNTVVPVSAALHHALDHLQENDREGLRHLMEAIRRISPEQLEKFLADESLYLELNPSDYPIPLDERQALRSNMEWTVFTTMARIAADRTRDIQAVEQVLYDLAGFDRLNDVLERHFFQRSQLLRCHRILNDVRRVLNKITYTHLPALRRREREEQARQEQFLTFIRQAAPANPQVAHDLETLVVRTCLTGWAKRIQALLEELGQDFAALSYQFEQYNSDFRALQQLLDNREVFSSAELDELQPLFGLYGLDIEKRLPPREVKCDYVATRQTYWRAVENIDAHAVRRAIAQQAVSRYSHMQAELSEPCR